MHIELMNRREPSKHVVFIANPASAGGRTAGRIGPVVQMLRSRCSTDVDIHITNRRGDAQRTAASLCETSGSRLLAVMGGDGTFQEVVNGLLQTSAVTRSHTCLGVISSGTGQGLAQSLGLPKGIPDQVEMLFGNRERLIDVGYVRARSIDGVSVERFFVNECQFGIGGEVVRRVESRNVAKKRFNGRVTFGYEALKVALSIPNRVANLRIDGSGMLSLSTFGLVVGNGAFTGGGMNLTAGADPGDGHLDLLIMKEQSVRQRVMNLSRIYSAHHVRRPDFELLPIHNLTVTSAEDLPIEADGEFLGYAPSEVRIVPHALRVAAEAGS